MNDNCHSSDNYKDNIKYIENNNIKDISYKESLSELIDSIYISKADLSFDVNNIIKKNNIKLEVEENYLKNKNIEVIIDNITLLNINNNLSDNKITNSDNLENKNLLSFIDYKEYSTKCKKENNKYYKIVKKQLSNSNNNTNKNNKISINPENDFDCSNTTFDNEKNINLNKNRILEKYNFNKKSNYLNKKIGILKTNINI